MDIGKEKFITPEQEIMHLRSEILRKERELMREGVSPDRDALISQELRSYKDVPQDVLHPALSLSTESIQSLSLNLVPETHDKKIEELLILLNHKGIKNTLSVVEKLKDAHIEDDFHRFLVQFVKKGFGVKGLKEKAPLSKALHMTLFEVVLPERGGEEKKTLKEMLSSMEQFYSGMMSISSEKNPRENYIAIELANSNASEEFIFYVAVPDSKRDLFEKHILAVFHDAIITEQSNDHNIFHQGGVVMASVAKSGNNSAFSIKTYESFDHDPLNVILNSFSKLNRDGEGACLQIFLSPAGDYYHKKYEHAISKIEKGASVKDATSGQNGLLGDFASTFGGLFGSSKKKDEKEPPKIDTQSIDRIRNKLSSPIMLCSVRLAVSASDLNRAKNIITELESGFNQFDDPQGNSIRWKRITTGGTMKKFLRSFSFRYFDRSEGIPFNLKEITSMVHFHTTALQGTNQLKTTRSGEAPAPVEMPTEGTLLGMNPYHGVEKKIYITDEDRLRHVYTIGQTGTGKTTLLMNMILQDIERGNGVCMIDPHGSDVQKVLANIPEHRLKDVVYFDPSYVSRPMGLNMLEYDPRFPEQKTFVVNELFSIFQKLYGAVPESMGPMFEQYFRNSTMLVIEDPGSGSTLLDVSRVLSDKEYRAMKISRCRNPIVVQFWKDIAEKAGGEAKLENIVPYITSKFDVFLANEIMRPIVAQERSAFNFREIMDQKKILLVNLAKGRLGDINSNLLGLILVGKILMAALSRVDVLGTDFPPFYLYIDEFQNITTPSIATILSEARKYKLSLYIAHQFIAQLEENTKNAVFGNVGTIISFRVGSDDAEYLEKQFEPVFGASQIINIDNFNAYVKMLVHGKPVKPFNIRCVPPPVASVRDLDSIKELSYLKYGRNRVEVEAEVMSKYQKHQVPDVESAPQI